MRINHFVAWENDCVAQRSMCGEEGNRKPTEGDRRQTFKKVDEQGDEERPENEWTSDGDDGRPEVRQISERHNPTTAVLEEEFSWLLRKATRCVIKQPDASIRERIKQAWSYGIAVV